MRTNVVRIGNSKAILLPEAMIEQCQLEGVVELRVEAKTLVIKAAGVPRENWATSFSAMKVNGDDFPAGSDTSIATEWDKSEWSW